jgi:hypothetical protein
LECGENRRFGFSFSRRTPAAASRITPENKKPKAAILAALQKRGCKRCFIPLSFFLPAEG